MINQKIQCPLCATEGQLFVEIKETEYYACPLCQGIYMNSAAYLTPQAEKERYTRHNNDVEDERYQKFVWPIVESVLKHYLPTDIGLDYGSGTGPVISKLLNDKGYQTNLYDPFFANYPENLTMKYDYIVCCEVMEHFHQPAEEFQKLHGLLKANGTLFLKTYLYDDTINFATWHYRADPTHVFFYRKQTLRWIQRHFDFAEVEFYEEHIELKL